MTGFATVLNEVYLLPTSQQERRDVEGLIDIEDEALLREAALAHTKVFLTPEQELEQNVLELMHSFIDGITDSDGDSL